MHFDARNILKDVKAGMSVEEAAAKELERLQAEGQEALRKTLVMLFIDFTKSYDVRRECRRLTENNVRAAFRLAEEEVISKHLWEHSTQWPKEEQTLLHRILDSITGKD